MAEKNYHLIASNIIDAIGGTKNVKVYTNCMTRLRLTVNDPNLVNIDSLKQVNNVLQVVNDNDIFQVVLGPGVVIKVAKEFGNIVNSASSTDTNNKVEEKKEDNNSLKVDANWKDNKAKIKAKQKRFGFLSKGMKHLANIFSPLIPAIIASGLFAALASIIKQVGGQTVTELVNWEIVSKWVPYNTAANVFFNLATALSSGFTSYLVIFTGVNAAKEFGATPMLGGFLGGICSIGNITSIAKLIGLYNVQNELASTLLSGKGGVIGVILACLILSYVEKFLHKKMPNSLDTVLTPFISILVVGCVYIFGIMIVAGYISDGICFVISKLTMNEHVIVRIIVGFIAAALFLPLVMTGMHHGLVAFYAEELIKHRYVSLYPVLAMAGAGQVGAAIALYIKAKRKKNNTIQRNIASSIVPGVLGVGEPLIYSVTLPLGTPFITAGLGAGIGGAFLLAFRVGSTSWGPSGFMAIPLMAYVNGQENMLGMGLYVIGLIISIIFGFVFTWFIVKDEKLESK